MAHLASDINLNGNTTCPLPDQALTSDEYLFLSTAYCIFLFLYVLSLSKFIWWWWTKFQNKSISVKIKRLLRSRTI